MKTFLENIKTLIIEIIGLVGGFIWAKHDDWHYEPLILIAVSATGIIIFIILRLLPNQEDRPIVEMEFVYTGGFRLPPNLIQNISPMDETGEYYIMAQGGTYLFEAGQHYDLIIRNNSKHNAYNLALYKLKNSYPLRFETKQNPLEPLTLETPKTIKVTYQVNRPMTHDDADKVYKSKLPEDLKDIVLVAEYRSESRKRYYTRFKLLDVNEHLTSFRDISNYNKI